MGNIGRHPISAYGSWHVPDALTGSRQRANRSHRPNPANQSDYDEEDIDERLFGASLDTPSFGGCCLLFPPPTVLPPETRLDISCWAGARSLFPLMEKQVTPLGPCQSDRLASCDVISAGK